MIAMHASDLQLAKSVAAIVVPAFSVIASVVKLQEITRKQRLTKRIDSILSIADKLPADHPSKEALFAIAEIDLNNLLELLKKRGKVGGQNAEQAPLPDPDVLRRYLATSARFEKLSPAGKQFVLDEVAKRDHDIVVQNRFRWAGVVTGFLITIAAFGLSLALLWNGQAWAGSLLGLGVLATLASTFVLSTRNLAPQPPRPADQE
jgi:hypothetical protein